MFFTHTYCISCANIFGHIYICDMMCHQRQVEYEEPNHFILCFRVTNVRIEDFNLVATAVHYTKAATPNFPLTILNFCLFTTL